MKSLFVITCIGFASLFSTISASESVQRHAVKLETTLCCPMSEELEALISVIPSGPAETENWEEWKASYVQVLSAMITLIESDKVGNTTFLIGVSENQCQDSQ